MTAGPRPYSINVGGRLLEVNHPLVMGVLNLTPDSFYAASRQLSERDIARRATDIVEQGAAIIDVGACSTRPHSTPASADEEAARLRLGLAAIRRAVPEAIISVDTFRSDVARRCVEEWGADIINDVSGGLADGDMFATVAQLGVPYILTHNARLLDASPGPSGHDAEPLAMRAAMLRHVGRRVQELHERGVADVILDPGIGFTGSMATDYELLTHLSDLHVLGLPLMVGVSRKSMIYSLLGTTPDEALTGTTVLHTLALQQGVSILRAHDVRDAVETVKILQKTWEYSTSA